MKRRETMIEEFLNYLRFERNRSPKTVKSYSDDLRAFEEFFKNLDNQLSWQSVDADIIRDWMESMMDKGNSATSVNRRLSALRSFYRFALANHLVERDPAHHVVGPKNKKPLPHFVKESEMNRLIDAVQWGTEYKEVRARTIIMTFYETGIRASELVDLNDSAIDFDNRQLKVTGKGSKQRMIPFGEELAVTLKHYMDVRNQNIVKQDEAVFLSEKGRRMTYAQVKMEVIRHLALVSTQKKLSPHVLRHTFATAMLNHGASIESIRRLLGHESASTTEIYTHTTFEQLKRVYNEAHPRA